MQTNVAYKTETYASKRQYHVALASNQQEVNECLRLRYQVFAGEMQADLNTLTPELDEDKFDAYCDHLMVRDSYSGEVVATTRLLDSDSRDQIGYFYSETEFDLDAILALSGRFMEVGRTCIHPEFRNGATLATLWQGLAKVSQEKNIDYMIGCASIPFDKGDVYLASVMHHLRNNAFSPSNLRAVPRVPLASLKDITPLEKVALPTLLKGYLRVGAKICGEAYWDAAFNVADVFILLDIEKLTARYSRKFMQN